MKLKTLVLLGAVLSLSACTNIQPVAEQHSGFLSDYSNLKPVTLDDGSKAMRWISPTAKDHKYTKAIVAPVTFFPAPQPNEQVSIETLNKISAYMTKEISTAVGKDFEITTKPGPDTIYLQFAITGVDTPMEGLNPLNVLPVSLLFKGVTMAAGEGDHATLLYVEGKATDAKTGELLAQGVRQGMGGSLKNDAEKLDVDKLKTLINGWALEIQGMVRKLKP